MSTIRTDNIQTTDNSVTLAVEDIAAYDRFSSSATGQGSDLITHTGTDDTVTEALDTVTEALRQVQVQGAATWSADDAPHPVNAQVYHNGKQWIALRENSAEPTEGEDWTELVGKKYIDDSITDLADSMQPSMTGSATLNGTTDNTVAMSDIVTGLDLEIGDVIRIDTGAYNKLHTVESITNNGSIIVNYEHAGNRGDGSLKLPDFTGQATVTRVAKWFNAPIGLGQAWVDVTSSRSLGVTSTNSTSRTIEVSFFSTTGTGNNNCRAFINSALVFEHAFGGGTTVGAGRNGYMYLLHHHSEELIIESDQPKNKWFERR